MSAEAVAVVASRTGVSPTVKLILLTLAIRSDDDDVCADSLSTLAELTGMDLSEVELRLGILAYDCIIYPDFEGEHSSGILLDTDAVRRRFREMRR